MLGGPQKCRGEAAKTAPPPPTLVSVSYRVDCVDADNGRNGGDSTTAFSASTFEAARIAALNAYDTSDLCQIDPNYNDRSRVMVRGSGRFV